MYLLINTSVRDSIALSLFDVENRIDKKFEVGNRELLQSIDSFLTSENKTKDDVAGIMVVVGKGSFTSTRLAVTVANTFGYVRHIPLLSVSLEQTADVQSLIALLLDQPVGQYLSATYSGVPNIGNQSS